MAFQVLIYGTIFGTQVLVLALALHFIYAVSKVQNLALGGIASAVAYTLYWCITSGFSIWMQILIPLLVALFLGYLNFWLNEPLTKKREHLLAMIVSFSFAVFLESLIAMLFGAGGKSFLSGITHSISLGALSIPLPGLFIIVFGAVLASSAFFFFRFLPFGRTFRAIAEDEPSAISLGARYSFVRLLAYLMGGIVAGGIGILAGFNTALVPTMGLPLMIMAFIVFLVGGVSDVRGTIIAAYLLSVIPELIFGLVPNVSLDWRMVIMFGIAAILLVFRPNGLFALERRVG